MADSNDILIIGAGPAGLIAAEHLAQAGRKVTILERMPSPARKFLMAGRGGLNLTHSEDLERFLTRYGPAQSFLEPAVRAFAPQMLCDWSAGLGQRTLIGSSGRVFPDDHKASPLLRAWLARLASLGVELRTRHRWLGWDDDGAVLVEASDGALARYRPAATLLALGGASWPRLGSDGGWVPFLDRSGVSVSPLAPANSGVEIAWNRVFLEKHEGQPLHRLTITIGDVTRAGEAVVTRYGLEGGALYALSRPIREALLSEGRANIVIDLRPGRAVEAMAAALASQPPSQSLANRLRKAIKLPPAAIGLLREAVGVALPTEPMALARLIRHVPLTVIGQRGLERAISTAGGIALEEIDADYMLKKLPGVFVAGEMLDWEAPTGGYLLQACFATGIAAAGGMARWLEARTSLRPSA